MSELSYCLGGLKMPLIVVIKVLDTYQLRFALTELWAEFGSTPDYLKLTFFKLQSRTRPIIQREGAEIDGETQEKATQDAKEVLVSAVVKANQ